jgi:hypothetical protein
LGGERDSYTANISDGHGKFASFVFSGETGAMNSVALPTTLADFQALSLSHGIFVGDGFGGSFTVRITQLLLTGAPVPEPATWTACIVGFGLVGSAMRRGQKVAVGYARIVGLEPMRRYRNPII